MGPMSRSGQREAEVQGVLRPPGRGARGAAGCRLQAHRLHRLHIATSPLARPFLKVDSLTPLLRPSAAPVYRFKPLRVRSERMELAAFAQDMISFDPNQRVLFQGELHVSQIVPSSRRHARKRGHLRLAPGKIRQKPMWSLDLFSLPLLGFHSSGSCANFNSGRYVIFKGTAVLSQSDGQESADPSGRAAFCSLFRFPGKRTKTCAVPFCEAGRLRSSREATLFAHQWHSQQREDQAIDRRSGCRVCLAKQ